MLKHMILFAVALTAAGCNEGTPASVVKQVKEVKSVDFSSVTTVGNHSYLPLEQYGTPAEHHTLILTVLQKFEEEHPQYEVTDWKIERTHPNSSRDKVSGLWIDHRPKPE